MNKVKDDDKSVFLNPEKVVLQDFKNSPNINENDLTLTSNKNMNFILDLDHFYCKTGREDYEKFNTDYLKVIVSNLKNFGFALVLLDENHVKKASDTINEMIKDNPNNHYLLKLYVVEKVPILTFLYVQVIQLKTLVVLDKLKFLLFEIYSNLGSSQSEEIPFLRMESTVDYLISLYSYQFYLKHVRHSLIYLYCSFIQVMLQKCQ